MVPRAGSSRACDEQRRRRTQRLGRRIPARPVGDPDDGSSNLAEKTGSIADLGCRDNSGRVSVDRTQTRACATPIIKRKNHPPHRLTGNHRSRSGAKAPFKRGGVVYLTFDDGPGPYTPAILNILHATHSTATFFELGFRQAQYPAEAARIRSAGQQYRQSHVQPHRKPDQADAQSDSVAGGARASESLRTAAVRCDERDCATHSEPARSPSGVVDRRSRGTGAGPESRTLSKLLPALRFELEPSS